MSESQTEANMEDTTPNKFKIGPGFGLFIMGVIYLVWWLIFFEAAIGDPRWGHNWAYAIIFITVGAAWYQKSAVSRTIAVVQAFMLPVTASGSVNTIIMTYITIIIAIIWAVVVLIERKTDKMFLKERMQKRSWLWINMHTLIIAWLLIAHMGLVFLIGRAPMEAQLRYLGLENIGVLTFLPHELHEIATWCFDIALFVWAGIVVYEQFKMGYNIKNKPWPKWSFWWTFVTMASGIVGLGIGALIFGV